MPIFTQAGPFVYNEADNLTSVTYSDDQGQITSNYEQVLTYNATASNGDIDMPIWALN
jgi:hypothetical protein